MHAATLLPVADGDLQAPERVLAPQRWLGKHWPGVALVITGHFFFDLRRPGTRARSSLPSMIGIVEPCVGDCSRWGRGLVRGFLRGLGHVSDDRLAAFADRYVLHRNLLLTTVR